jgi:hypothetical protein
LHLIAAADEQGIGEEFPQPAQCRAHRGLAAAKPDGGGADTAPVIDGRQHAQQVEVEVIHGSSGYQIQ